MEGGLHCTPPLIVVTPPSTVYNLIYADENTASIGGRGLLSTFFFLFSRAVTADHLIKISISRLAWRYDSCAVFSAFACKTRLLCLPRKFQLTARGLKVVLAPISIIMIVKTRSFSSQIVRCCATRAAHQNGPLPSSPPSCRSTPPSSPHSPSRKDLSLRVVCT